MTHPLFTIITPTIQRASLLRCCESVDAQTFKNWQHVTMVDGVHKDEELWAKIERGDTSKRRQVYCCGTRHNDFGNTCRHNAWEHAAGRWVLYVDDDNYLSDPHVLADLAYALADVSEPWCLFPILRYGERFFNDPPGLTLTDTANVVVRRAIARWPAIPNYEADGLWIEGLRSVYPYRAFPNHQPIVTMEESNYGK